MGTEPFSPRRVRGRVLEVAREAARDTPMDSTELALSPTSVRYTYTPVHLLPRPPPPLLGFREAPPVYASFLPSRPARAAGSPTSLRADGRSLVARVVPPPAFFAPSPDPGDAAAANALWGLADAAFNSAGEAAKTTPKKTKATTAPRSGRKRSRGGLITSPKPTARDEPKAREDAPARVPALPQPPPSKRSGGSRTRPVPAEPAATPLEEMEYRELKYDVFPAVFGRSTTSNNKGWIYKRIREHFDAHGDPRVQKPRAGSRAGYPLKDATNKEALLSAA